MGLQGGVLCYEASERPTTRGVTAIRAGNECGDRLGLRQAEAAKAARPERPRSAGEDCLNGVESVAARELSALHGKPRSKSARRKGARLGTVLFMCL